MAERLLRLFVLAIAFALGMFGILAFAVALLTAGLEVLAFVLNWPSDGYPLWWYILLPFMHILAGLVCLFIASILAQAALPISGVNGRIANGAASKD